MEIITPASPQKDYSDKKIVFLGGPIKGAPDWQSQAINDLADLDIYVANPRREKVENFNLDLQIAWESKFLAAADIILFWIPPKQEDIAGREYAQTSRFELGEWAAKTNYNQGNKKLVVGIDDAFFGKSYIQLRLEEHGMIVHNNYNDTIKELRKLIQNKHKIFFTSDTHFSSERTLKFSRRPFASVDEMNENIIKNWNNIVSPEDGVYHLGDFGDLSFASKLNGKIHLILGNYETEIIKENPAYIDKLESLFFKVMPNETIALKDGSLLYMTHKPSDCKRNMFCAFGHIHGLKKVNYFGVNVGVDANHFMPLDEDDILFYKNAIINHYDYEVFL